MPLSYKKETTGAAISSGCNYRGGRRPIEPKRARELKELRDIERTTLKPGESSQLTFVIDPDRDLTIYDEATRAYAVDPGHFEVQVGASSADIGARSTFEVVL